MDKQIYIQALRGVLSGVADKQYDDIIIDVESYSAQNPNADLTKHFGMPEEFARRRLQAEQEPYISIKPSRIRTWIRRFFLTFGILPLSLIAIFIAFITIYADDKFDYGAYDGLSVLKVSDSVWQNETITDTLNNINIEQARVVVYWQAQDNKNENNGESVERSEGKTLIKYSCQRDIAIINAQGINIRHNDCLLILPLKPFMFNVFQADSVIVAPQADVMLTLKQARLRIAERGADYRYQIQHLHSDVVPMSSSNNAQVGVSVTAVESQISPYHFE